MGRKTGSDALFRPVRDEMVLRTFDFYPDFVPTAQSYTQKHNKIINFTGLSFKE